jgi:hypothetical protein
MKRRWDETDFEQMTWHDCHVWGIHLRAGDPEQDGWISDLIFDLDYIAEWICAANAPALFRVAPAQLVFHGVTDLAINVNWGGTGFQCALHDMSIDRVDREPVIEQKVFLDRPYHKWTIHLNWPAGGKIIFGAVGFTQTLSGSERILDRQKLSLAERSERIAEY